MTQDEIHFRLRSLMQQFAALKRTMQHDAAKFCGSEEIVFHYGRQYARDIERERVVRRMAERQCFQNATTMCHFFADRLAYCEGFAMSVVSPFPIHHAWVVNKDTGGIIDPTWTVQDEPYSYFGVALDHEWALKRQLRCGYYALFDAPSLGSFCRRGIPKAGLAKIAA